MASNKNNQDEKLERQPAIFEEVLDAEIAYFNPKASHKEYTGAKCEDGTHACDSEYAATVVARAHAEKLSGIAFSGGGIRSATFNLGVLQALARFNLLTEFNYLSTVSGGGYIGSWLAAWIKREDQNRCDCGNPEESGAEDGLEYVSAELAAAAGEGPERKRHGAMQPDPSPIHHLREYSNYLTPHRGALSTDAWALGAVYTRNLIMTLGVLLGTVTAIVLLAQAYASGFGQIVMAMMSPTQHGFWTWPYILFTLLMSSTAMLLGIELSPRRTASAQSSVLAYVAVALSLAAAAMGSLWLATLNLSVDKFSELVMAALPLMFSIMVFGFGGRWFGNHGVFGDARPGDREADKRALPWLIIGGILSLLTLVVLWQWAAPWISGWSDGLSMLANLHIVVWGVPVVVAIFGIAAAVFVGFAGAALKELEREWLARFFAALAKWTFLYTLLMALVVYSFCLVQQLPEVTTASFGGYLKPGLSGLWAMVSAAGAYFARSTPSGPSGIARRLRRALVVIAPSVFILGLLVITVWVTTHAMYAMVISLVNAAWFSAWPFFDTITHSSADPSPGGLLATSGYWMVAGVAGLALFMVTIFWSRRVGVNDFSIHALYGNRLIRAYLGASNLHRHAHPFTGFAHADNSLRMAELIKNKNKDEDKGTHYGPYLIINAAINLVAGRRLAWQQRKAASFTFTPQFCGYEFCDANNDTQAADGHRTGGYARSEFYGGEGGVSLGKAMTISGAAASPNMGYHSSPALGLLMATFNVRLGWWLPNTAMSDTGLLRQRGPRMGLMYLIMEALGLTDARKDYVYLSDGGHFENLGIYELVRRRCRLVIACDAEADPDLTFSGLGNAIEKCRTDLGVPINIDVGQIRRGLDTGKSRWHCAVGCIRYSEADPGNHDGALLYIKGITDRR